jgi:O-antigen ligase
VYGIVQYGMLHYDSLGQRPRGTLGHYMTYSGTLMLVIGATTARLVFGSRDRLWAGLVLPALIVALALTLTRSAWVGSCLAVGLLFMLKDFRLTALVPLVVAVLFALAPDSVTNRMVSVFDLRAPTPSATLRRMIARACPRST